MQKIPISLAAAGMVLAKEIRKDDDDISPPICGKGVALTESLISRLERMGVQAVTVEGHPVRTDDDKSVDELLQGLDRRFSKVEGDPLMMNLKAIYRENIMLSHGAQDAGQEN